MGLILNTNSDSIGSWIKRKVTGLCLLLQVVWNPSAAYKVLGNAVQASDEDYLEWHKYGLFGPKIYVLCKSNLIAQVFAPQNRQKFQQVGDFSDIYNGRSVQNSGGHPIEWKFMRRSSINFFATQLPKQITGVVDTFKTAVGMWTKNKVPIDLHYELLRTILHGQAKVFFDASIEEYDPKQRTKASFTDVCDRAVNKLYSGKNVLTPEERCWFHEQSEAIFQRAPPGTLAHHFMQIHLENPKEVTYEIALSNARMLLVALTPAYALFWTLVCLLRHPKALAQAKRDSTYLSMCLKEAMRLYPPVPFLIPRVTQKAHDFGSFVAEPGSWCLMSGSWSQTKTEFNPERWQSKGKVPGSVEFDVNYFPFGAGDHSCLGQYWQYYAAPMLQAVLKNLLSDCSWTVIDDALEHSSLLEEKTMHLSAYHRPSASFHVRVESNVPSAPPALD